MQADKQLSDEQSREIAETIREELARRRISRQALAEQAKLKVREGQLEESWMEALELLESLQAELEALS